MKSFLYILCEGERDEVFYERLAERATGQSFEVPKELRLRRGTDWKAALVASRLLLKQVRHWHGDQEVAVILSVDNDRAPKHPGAEPPPKPFLPYDQRKAPRHAELRQMVEGALGKDHAKWPVKVALAVPVEMIESWLLRLLNPNCGSLPFFAQAAQQSARQWHGGTPPPQLKDLRDAEARKLGMTKDELFLHAAEQDVAAAAATTPSLRMFLDDLAHW